MKMIGWIQTNIISNLFRDVRNKHRLTWREVTQIITLSILSLLLPLSFLLLARLSTAHYLLAVFGGPLLPPYLSFTIPSYIFLYVNSFLLHSLLSFVTMATLVHVLTGWVTNIVMESISPRSRIYIAWIILCTLQVCVGLGIEGSIAAGIDASGFRHQTSMMSKMVFFLGLHETMLFWSTSVVKPVADDTIFGCVREKKWMEKVAMSLSFGALWWGKMREEVDSLVVVGELRRAVLGDVGVADLMGWWLYYITVVIGVVRVVKGVGWIGKKILFGKVHANSSNKVKSNMVDHTPIDEKL